MSLSAIALSSFTIALSGVLNPGPLLAITVTRSLKYGAKQGPLLIFGHSILELVMVVFLVAAFGLLAFQIHTGQYGGQQYGLHIFPSLCLTV
ncbi:MAG: hypothetical protein NC830_07520 [Candidatus Omnitrophica bacterium]|nr:hypothetical protein [Candidatus Omnitrophota bacterium]